MKKLFLMILFSLILFGCASVPMAPLEADSHAKLFFKPQNKAVIYLFRDTVFGGESALAVYLDNKYAGHTAANTYCMWIVSPGEHTIRSQAEDVSILRINTVVGKQYFVRQELSLGWAMARSTLQEVSDEEGKAAILHCKLILTDQN
jgi:hypothetical protein